MKKGAQTQNFMTKNQKNQPKKEINLKRDQLKIKVKDNARLNSSVLQRTQYRIDTSKFLEANYFV